MIDLPRTAFDVEGLRLRLPRESDANDIVAACADPPSRRFLHRLPHPYRRSDALWWVTEGVPASWAMGGAAFVIADHVSDKVIGAAGISRVLAQRQQGEVGFWVAPWARGRGVARASTVGLSSWAFEHGFSRLELPTEAENTAGQRVALAAGFRWEGVRRLAGVGRDGTRHDLIVWTRLSQDQPGPTARTLPDLPGGELTDGVIMLRPLGEADADDMYQLAVLPEIVASAVPPREPARADVVRLCTHAASRWLAGTRADLSIRDSASGAFA